MRHSFVGLIVFIIAASAMLPVAARHWHFGQHTREQQSVVGQPSPAAVASRPPPAVTPPVTKTAMPISITDASSITPVAEPTIVRETPTAAPEKPAEQPVPQIAPVTNPRILFGLGSQPDSALTSPLNMAAPLQMYSSWYNGPGDLEWMRNWYTSGFIQKTIYGTGRAAHLIIWSDVPNATSPACGRPYPISTRILDDMKTLATYWAGTPSDPPLYVTLFTEFQTYPCTESQWSGAEGYYALLQQRMLEIRDIFHANAPNARVSIGWGGWQARWDDPGDGGGKSLISHFADVMRQMDFQSVQFMSDDGNDDDAQRMVSILGAYGPVMVAHYKPEHASTARFHDDIAAIMTDDALGKLVAHGLFAWSFMDQSMFNNPEDPIEAANFSLVVDAVRRYSRR